VFFRAEKLQDVGGYLGSLFNFSMPKANLPISQFTPVEAYAWIAIALGILFATAVPGMIFDKLTKALSGKKRKRERIVLDWHICSGFDSGRDVLAGSCNDHRAVFCTGIFRKKAA